MSSPALFSRRRPPQDPGPSFHGPGTTAPKGWGSVPTCSRLFLRFPLHISFRVFLSVAAGRARSGVGGHPSPSSRAMVAPPVSFSLPTLRPLPPSSLCPAAQPPPLHCYMHVGAPCHGARGCRAGGHGGYVWVRGCGFGCRGRCLRDWFRDKGRHCRAFRFTVNDIRHQSRRTHRRSTPPWMVIAGSPLCRVYFSHTPSVWGIHPPPGPKAEPLPVPRPSHPIPSAQQVSGSRPPPSPRPTHPPPCRADDAPPLPPPRPRLPVVRPQGTMGRVPPKEVRVISLSPSLSPPKTPHTFWGGNRWPRLLIPPANPSAKPIGPCPAGPHAAAAVGPRIGAPEGGGIRVLDGRRCRGVPVAGPRPYTCLRVATSPAGGVEWLVFEKHWPKKKWKLTPPPSAPCRSESVCPRRRSHRRGPRRPPRGPKVELAPKASSNFSGHQIAYNRYCMHL